VAVVLALGWAGAIPASAAKGADLDPGIGTEAALENPDCDPATGQIRFSYYAAPTCVKPWNDGDDNGGKVAPGVTADSVKVVVLWNDLPPDASTTGIWVNQATGGADPDGARAAAIDNSKVFEQLYETWGRTVDFEFVRSTGNDEAAQRADAITVAALEPFAVLDLAASTGTPGVGGGSVFQQALVNAGVPFVSPVPQTQMFLSRAWAQITAELLAKQKLTTGKAEYAGEALQDQRRKVGVLRSSNFDMPYFEQQLKKHDLPKLVDAEFVIPETQSSVRVDAASGGLETQIPT
jgi:hypothetical protein